MRVSKLTESPFLIAQVPMGAMRVGPDTTSFMPDTNLRHFSGYDFVDRYVRGFSHTVIYLLHSAISL